MRSSYAGDPRWIQARYKGTCAGCSGAIARHAQVWFYPSKGHRKSRTYCEPCGQPMSREFDAAVADEDFMNRQF